MPYGLHEAVDIRLSSRGLKVATSCQGLVCELVSTIA